MKKFLFCMITAVVAMATACNKDDNVPIQNQITIVTEANIGLLIAGFGTVTIDWGDGEEIKTYTLEAYDERTWGNYYNYRVYGVFSTYSNPSTPHTITLTGGNITHLDCSGNRFISHLNISKNSTLKFLICRRCQFSELDISNNTTLQHLDVSDNRLTSLKVSNNTALIEFFCNSNGLTNMDVNNNPVLTTLDCGYNQLTSLDISGNTALRTLRCSYNQIASLDVSNNPELTTLLCMENQLTSLDMRKNTMLRILRCQSNQLTTEALDALFGTLHARNTLPGLTKTVYICDNPGAEWCNQSHATMSGWQVDIRSMFEW